MPPKKVAAPEKKTLLGRPSNNLKIGIVGLPNVGKSSFFNVLSDTGPSSSVATHRSPYTSADLGKAANFPYATINPEGAFHIPPSFASPNSDSPTEARIMVPDARFDWLVDLYKPASRVPAALTCIDIAGLTAVRLTMTTEWEAAHRMTL
jgi:obg-like ATPase 1